MKQLVMSLALVSMTSVALALPLPPVTSAQVTYTQTKNCPYDIQELVAKRGLTLDFDLTNAPTKPGGNGYVLLPSASQFNFDGPSLMLANEGLSNASGFMLKEAPKSGVTINKLHYTLKQLSLLILPESNYQSTIVVMPAIEPIITPKPHTHVLTEQLCTITNY